MWPAESGFPLQICILCSDRFVTKLRSGRLLHGMTAVVSQAQGIELLGSCERSLGARSHLLAASICTCSVQHVSYTIVLYPGLELYT